jgi:hypothetical protein
LANTLFTMLPGKIVRFLEEYANVGFAGTRDRGLVPCACRVSGWRVHSDGRTMTLLIPEPLVNRILASLDDNGQIAVTIGEHPTHETYQLKGRYARRRDVTPDDVELVARFRTRFVRAFRTELPRGVSEELVGTYLVPDPAVAVDADVREVYLQTPGPGAGARLYPPAEQPSVEGRTR